MTWILSLMETILSPKVKLMVATVCVKAKLRCKGALASFPVEDCKEINVIINITYRTILLPTAFCTFSDALVDLV